jgi:hypothetical protein
MALTWMQDAVPELAAQARKKMSFSRYRLRNFPDQGATPDGRFPCFKRNAVNPSAIAVANAIDEIAIQKTRY